MLGTGGFQNKTTSCPLTAYIYRVPRGRFEAAIHWRRAVHLDSTCGMLFPSH